MAGLDVSERRKPQDGHFRFDRMVDVRVSCLPTVWGESVDMRLLPSADRALTRMTLDSGTVLRESPVPSAPAVLVLAQDRPAELLGHFGGFSLVRVPEAGTGWVAAHMIGLPPSCCQR